MTQAINLLKEASLPEAALMLAYAGMDQMTWLADEKEEPGSQEFKAWCTKYLPLEAIGCSVDDLWGARCGLLHMGTSESRDYKKNKAQQIFYYEGLQRNDRQPDAGEIYVNHVNLICGFISGALQCIADFEYDPDLLQRMEERAARLLSYKPVDWSTP